MTINIKEIISTAVSENRDRYCKLNEHERHQLVSALLEDSDQVLIDADNELALQKAIAKSILHFNDKFFFTTACELLREIYRIFVSGDERIEAYFAEKINILLHEEWIEQNSVPNEHFENDGMNRARDAQLAMNPMSYY